MQVIIDLHQCLLEFSLGVYGSEVVASSPFSTLFEGRVWRRERGGERRGGETK